MPKLNDEIKRLARREVGSDLRKLRADVAALKRQLAAQKRQTAQLARDTADLVADLKSRLATPPRASEKEVQHSHLSPRLIRLQRERLGLSRAAFGKLVGRSGPAVGTWESGGAKPGSEARAAIVGLRKLGKREVLLRLAAMRPASQRVPPAARTKAPAPELGSSQDRPAAAP